eukprot:657356-Amphidinium_carterae.1
MNDAGAGKPIGGWTKGKWRGINDGGGLCSGNRWPIDRRRLAVGLEDVRGAILSWFMDWAGKRDLRRLVLELACRRGSGSPFGEDI